MIRWLRRLVSAVVLSMAPGIVGAQVYDFSLTFSGAVAGFYTGSESETLTLRALVTYDGNGTITSLYDARIRLGNQLFDYSVSSFSGTYNTTTSAITSFALAGTVPPLGARVDTTNLRAEIRFGSFEVSAATLSNQDGVFTNRTTYLLGGQTYDFTNGNTAPGLPIPAPEINGGKAILAAFVLATLALAISNQRRRRDPSSSAPGSALAA
jgi:hypothetical protein